MADIAEIQLEIKAVKFALASFTRYRNKEKEREAFLDSQLETVQFLDVYSDFPKDKLQDALNKLQDALNKQQDALNKQQDSLNKQQDALNKQQDEKNLLLEKENLLLAQLQGGVFICECLNLQ
jgi:ElaB/YqjD/DUF883 family membrane-anchored ribosome-binding protein